MLGEVDGPGWQWLLDIATVLGSCAAIVVALGLLARTRPIRWLWRTLISVPMGHWFRAEVASATEPRFACLERSSLEHAETLRAHTALEEQVTGEILGRVDDLTHSVAKLDLRVTDLIRNRKDQP